MATRLVKTSSFTDILYPSVEDQINYFLSGDTENDNTNSLEILKVIDNANNNTKYKKMDVLLSEIKNEMSDFI